MYDRRMVQKECLIPGDESRSSTAEIQIVEEGKTTANDASMPCNRSDEATVWPLHKNPSRVFMCGAELNVLDIMGRVATGRSSSKSFKKRRKEQKRVSFAENCEIDEYERSQDPELLWYTADERRHIRDQCQFMVDLYQFQSKCQWAIKVLHNINKEYISDRDLDEAHSILAGARGFRGLEGRVEQTSCDLRWILNHQMAVLQTATGPAISEKQLRKASRSFSRPGAEFALALTEFDAQEAAVSYCC